MCVWVDSSFVIQYNVGSQTTEQTAQGDTMSITKLKNKLFNDKYREELNRVHQELEEQEIEINNEIVSADNLTELDDIDIQKFCNEQEAYESLDSLDSFSYLDYV